MTTSPLQLPAHIVPPAGIELKVSSIDHTRIGAFSKWNVTKGTEFGPFVGRKVYNKDDVSIDQRYSWEVFDLETFKFLYTIDATDPADGNWMRYVCCARYFEEQNIVSTQNGHHVLYKALKDIEAGEEMLTWFQPRKKKRNSLRQSADQLEQIAASKYAKENEAESEATGKTKRKRKPKIIPDSYDGPFDFEESISERKEEKVLKSSKGDVFEPLQPGQKRRRRKKIVDTVDSENISIKPENLIKTDSAPIKEEDNVPDGNDDLPVNPDTTNDTGDTNTWKTKDKEQDVKKSGYLQTLAEVNESVEWDYPAKGLEYIFELQSHHIVIQGGKRIYKCDICLGLYKHMFSLKRHYLRNHVNYKYLSKADITNCLINLAQAKLNMNARMQKKIINTKICGSMSEITNKDTANNIADEKLTESEDVTSKTHAHIEEVINNVVAGIVDEVVTNTGETDTSQNKNEFKNTGQSNLVENIGDSELNEMSENDGMPDTATNDFRGLIDHNTVNIGHNDALKEMESAITNTNGEQNIDKGAKGTKEDSSDSVECDQLGHDKLKDKKEPVDLDTLNGIGESCMDVEDNLDESNNELNSSTNSLGSASNASELDAAMGKSIASGATNITNENHEYPGLFQCYRCYEVFDRVPEIRRHLMEHPNSKDGSLYLCGLCNMHFSFKHNLVRHQKVHEEECNEGQPKSEGQGQPVKPRSSQRKQQLLLRNDVSDELKIESPPKLETIQPPKSYRCGICPQKYDSQDALVVHVESKHKNGSKYQCKYCGKDFLSMPNMKKHVRFHLGYRATCRECNELFTNVGSLRKHTRTAHPEVYRAKLVERLEKFGVLRGPDKNALKKKIVDKVVSRRGRPAKQVADDRKQDREKAECDSEKVETGTNVKEGDGELHGDTELSFAADEIDDGGSRFKFSCTVCKKRFSSYINMCRHRRKVHNNENKPQTSAEHCLTFTRQTKAPSPIVENPEETAAFYSNVSHNIATNLNCYLDGTEESLEKFLDYIKVDGYQGHLGYSAECAHKESDNLTWEHYNLPRNFSNTQLLSVSDSSKVHRHIQLNGHCEVESNKLDLGQRGNRETGDRKHSSSAKNNSEHYLKETSQQFQTEKLANNITCTIQNTNSVSGQQASSITNNNSTNSDVQNSADKATEQVESVVPGADVNHVDKMGIASYGLKLLSGLVPTKKATSAVENCKRSSNKDPKDDSKGFYKLTIADGQILNTESPAAKTFHQVQLGEYANFQDEFLCHETVSLDDNAGNNIDNKNIPRNQSSHTHNVENHSSYSDDQAVLTEMARLNQSAQDELDDLYDEIDSHINGAIPVKQQMSPNSLSSMCECMLGLTPVPSNVSEKYSLRVHGNNCAVANGGYHSDESCMSSADESDGNDEVVREVKQEQADYTDAQKGSPFFNYDTIAFGSNGDIQRICATCKRQFRDFDTLVRHHWKKHPETLFSVLEVEVGNGVEDLHFPTPSRVGILGVADPGLDITASTDSYKCTHCRLTFKTMAKLHVHIVNCSPIDPLYGAHKHDRSPSKASLKKKLDMFENTQDSTSPDNNETVENLESLSAPCYSAKAVVHRKRIFTGCRKWKSVILPDSPVKKIEEPAPVVPDKPSQPVVVGYNPRNHVRRRELTQVVDLLTCEGCGLKCKTIILLERHVRHCTRKEKFRTMKPLTCPIIDESVEKIKNMCFYCDKNFTYTKSLINHFQDFCQVKKAKLDLGEITEEHKQREAAILERIKKGEEMKIQQKEKEAESRTKRRITWQVGRKPKRKGNSWTLAKKKQSQLDEEEDASSDNEADTGNNSDTEAGVDTEVNKQMATETENVHKPKENELEHGDETTRNKSEKSKVSQSTAELEENGEKAKPETTNLSLSSDAEKDTLKSKSKESGAVQKDAGREKQSSDNSNVGKDLTEVDNDTDEQTVSNANMNMSLNCTARYNVNEVNQGEKVRANEPSKSSSVSSLLFQCITNQTQSLEGADTLRRRTRTTNQPDATTIVEGKRKRATVGKVEEFLKNAFSRKRKRRQKEESDADAKVTTTNIPITGSAGSSTKPLVALATHADSGKLEITSLVFLPNNTSDEAPSKTFQPIRPAVPQSGATGPSISVPVVRAFSAGGTSGDPVTDVPQPVKKPRGRPRKLRNIEPAPVISAAAVVSPISPQATDKPKRRPGRPPLKKKGNLAQNTDQPPPEGSESNDTAIAQENISKSDDRMVENQNADEHRKPGCEIELEGSKTSGKTGATELANCDLVGKMDPEIHDIFKDKPSILESNGGCEDDSKLRRVETAKEESDVGADYVDGDVNIDTSKAITSELTDIVTKQEPKTIESTDTVMKQDSKTIQSTDIVTKQDAKTILSTIQSTDIITKQDAQTVQSTDIVTKEDAKVIQSTDIVTKQDAKSIQPTDIVTKQDAKSIQATDIVTKQDIKTIQPTDIATKQDVKTIQPTDIVTKQDVKTIQPTDIVTKQDGKTIQSTDRVKKQEDKTDKVTSIDTIQEYIEHEEAQTVTVNKQDLDNNEFSSEPIQPNRNDTEHNNIPVINADNATVLQASILSSSAATQSASTSCIPGTLAPPVMETNSEMLKDEEAIETNSVMLEAADESESRSLPVFHSDNKFDDEYKENICLADEPIKGGLFYTDKSCNDDACTENIENICLAAESIKEIFIEKLEKANSGKGNYGDRSEDERSDVTASTIRYGGGEETVISTQTDALVLGVTDINVKEASEVKSSDQDVKELISDCITSECESIGTDGDEISSLQFSSNDEMVHGLILSPGERVKMNRRSCKKDIDLASPVWVKRTKQHVKFEKKDNERTTVISERTTVIKEQVEQVRERLQAKNKNHQVSKTSDTCIVTKETSDKLLNKKSSDNCNELKTSYRADKTLDKASKNCKQPTVGSPQKGKAAPVSETKAASGRGRKRKCEDLNHVDNKSKKRVAK